MEFKYKIDGSLTDLSFQVINIYQFYGMVGRVRSQGARRLARQRPRIDEMTALFLRTKPVTRIFPHPQFRSTRQSAAEDFFESCARYHTHHGRQPSIRTHTIARRARTTTGPHQKRPLSMLAPTLRYLGMKALEDELNRLAISRKRGSRPHSKGICPAPTRWDLCAVALFSQQLRAFPLRILHKR